ncbi:MAG: ERAP1-like C-terminal domain-containing protein, partial [Nitrospiria bacterium]
TPEERDRYLIALADFQKPMLTRKVLSFLLSDSVRAQDVWRPIRSLLANPITQGETWDFIRRHWSALRKKGGSVGAQRIIQATRSLWRGEWLQEVKTFFNNPANKVPSAARTLLQSLEFIELGIQFKERQRDCLSRWLQERPK